MRIVALVPGGIGDQVLFFPTLDELKQEYPDAQIDVVVEPKAKDAYRVSKSVHETILFDFQGRNSLADFGNLLGVLRDREFDIALSLQRSWSMNFLLWLSGIPTRVGFAGPGQSFLTSAVPFQANQYTAALYHDLLSGLSLAASCPALAVRVPARDLDWAEAERKRLGVQSSGYVLIAGGTLDPARPGKGPQGYPVESWKGIIQDFERKQPNLPIVLVQEPGDQGFAAAMVAANPPLKVTMPEDIGKLAAMIAGANLMLCTEGVPMQLAVAVQTYTLAIFGATDPKKTLPEDNRFVGIKSLTGNLADIAPQTVLEKVWGG